MTDEQKAIIESMSSVRPGAMRRVAEAAVAVLRLAWEYRSEDFRFEDYPELNDSVNALLRALSDKNINDAEARTSELLRLLSLPDWEDDALSWSEREQDDESALWRLDLHASHLKEILAAALAVAAIRGLSMARAITMVQMPKPWMDEEWVKSGMKGPKWGSGYAGDISVGITVIEQGIIAEAAARARWLHAVSKGAAYYIRHRASGFICPWCDSFCERKIPIEQYMGQTHPRCVCYNVYYDADGKVIGKDDNA